VRRFPFYGTLMAAGIVTALCHGAFFGLGTVVAADLAGPHKTGAG
jgi:MFS transporter, DHA1 family, inner membrane transport protein